MGADDVFDVEGRRPASGSRRCAALTHGEGVDVVIEAAGSARAIEEGLTLVRDGGRYVVAGHYTDVGPSPINAHQHINRKHLEIRGCWGSEAGHFLRALTVLERYAADVPWRRIGARTYPLDRLNDALADAEAMRITKALVDPVAGSSRIAAQRGTHVTCATPRSSPPRPGQQRAGDRSTRCSPPASTSSG